MNKAIDNRLLSGAFICLEKNIYGLSVPNTPFAFYALLVLCFSLIAAHSFFGVVLTLVFTLWLPRKFVNSAKYIIALVATKILFSISTEAYQGFDFYDFSLDALAQEVYTLFAFLFFFYIGKNIATYKYFIYLGAVRIYLIMLSSIFVHYLIADTVFFHGVDASQVLFFFAAFMLASDKNFSLLWGGVSVATVLSVASMLLSTFTSLAAVMIVLLYLYRFFDEDKVYGNFKFILIVAFLFFSLSSFFAYFVHIKNDDITEGNNGYTRAILAKRAVDVALEHPVLGTQMGRGIVPVSIIYELDWRQYFDGSFDGLDFNIYALSFHNGFLYLITRFGLLSVLIFYYILSMAPIVFTVRVLLFSMILFLAISANVVIESIRTGPAVALLLGTVFSFCDERDVCS